MGQQFNDFTQYTVGTFPTDWSAFTEASGGGLGDTRHLTVVDLLAEGLGAGKGLKFDAGSDTGSFLRSYVWDAITSGSDLEVAYRFLCTNSSLCEVQGALRMDLSSVTWYQGGPRSGDDLDLNKYVNGSFTNLANNTAQDWINENNWQWCRFRVNGTALEVKIWNDGATEPLTWDVVDTDTSITSGGVGFTTFRDRVFYVADYGAGTNGDTAPTGPVTPGGSDDLTASDISSTTEVTAPALAQTHDLTADDVSSMSGVTAPDIGQVHSLTAGNVESASETGTPAIQQQHALASVDISSLSTVSSPDLIEIAGQDTLSANDVEATSTVTSPALAQVHVLQPNSAQSQTETGEPAIGQAHQLMANDLTSTSRVSSPTLRDASQVLVTPIKNTKATVSQTTYKAAIIQTVYKAEAS